MRPIINYFEHLGPEKTAAMEIGLCTPYVYEFEGDKMVRHEVIEVPGIVTMGASITEKKVAEGRI
jgi:hypothetical protein